MDTCLKKWRHSLWLPLACAGFACTAASSPLVAQTPAPSAPAKAATSSAPVAPALTPVSIPSVPPVTATDADSRQVTLNQKERVTVVLICTEENQTEVRDAAGKLDSFRGLPLFRVIAVVDLRDSLGNMVEGIVRWRMQEDLDEEAERITPFYRANGNTNDPRPDLSAVPDFNGDICKALGWSKSSNKLRVIVFGQDGQPLQRWDELKDHNELLAVVRKALGKS